MSIEARLNGHALGDFRPLPLVPQSDEQAEATRAEADALLAEANRLHRKAQDDAGRTVSAARAEAERIRGEAKAEMERRQRRDDRFDTWAARGIIAGTVGLTASGEYSLARLVGFDWQVAWLFPFVIDVYVIQAFRRHRDIVQAIALTVAANVTYHLADAGLFGVTRTAKPTWWLIALVASVASLILWRIHLMVAPPKARRESRVRAPRETAPESESAPVPLSPPPAPEPPRESAGESESTPTPAPRESRPRCRKTGKRESARKVAPIGDIDRETDQLVTLMRQRGDADAVSLKDALRITGKAEATAARRLSTARAQYRRETTTDSQTGS